MAGYQEGGERAWWWKVAMHLDAACLAAANAMAHNVDDPSTVHALQDKLREGQVILLEIFRAKGLLPAVPNVPPTRPSPPSVPFTSAPAAPPFPPPPPPFTPPQVSEAVSIVEEAAPTPNGTNLMEETSLPSNGTNGAVAAPPMIVTDDVETEPTTEPVA